MEASLSVIKHIQAQAVCAEFKYHIHVGCMGILMAVGNGLPEAVVNHRRQMGVFLPVLSLYLHLHLKFLHTAGQLVYSLGDKSIGGGLPEIIDGTPQLPDPAAGQLLGLEQVLLYELVLFPASLLLISNPYEPEQRIYHGQRMSGGIVHLLGNAVALFFNGKTLIGHSQFPALLQKLVISSHICEHNGSRNHISLLIPVDILPDLQPSPFTIVFQRKYRCLRIRTIRVRALFPQDSPERFHIISGLQPQPMYGSPVAVGNLITPVIHHHALCNGIKYFIKGHGIDIQEIIPEHSQQHENAGQGKSRWCQVKACSHKPRHIEQVKSQRHCCSQQYDGNMRQRHTVLFKSRQHHSHAGQDADIGIGHMDVKYRPVHHLSHLETGIE